MKTSDKLAEQVEELTGKKPSIEIVGEDEESFKDSLFYKMIHGLEDEDEAQKINVIFDKHTDSMFYSVDRKVGTIGYYDVAE